jgi:malate dehydrogenase (oxaloacetate-decarboxylating)
VATGSPFPPVWIQGKERVIGQCNNCFVFPGLGFAAMAVGASQVSEAMIDACVEALAEQIPASLDPEAPLMPALRQARQVSDRVAEAVALAAFEEGLATRASTAEEALRCLRDGRWEPVYPQLRPAEPGEADPGQARG